MITFEQVYEAVVKRHSEDDLNVMGHRKLADEIYQEFQRLRTFFGSLKPPTAPRPTRRPATLRPLLPFRRAAPFLQTGRS